MSELARKDAGFSLLELAILMSVVGLLAASALETYRIYSKTKTYNATAANAEIISTALTRFVSLFGRLPCPADPSLPVSDANAGLEQCLTALSGNGCSGQVCRVSGARDVDGDMNNEPVLVGSIPYVTLSVALNDSFDGWGNKMSYAITQSLTNSLTFDDTEGVINLTDYQTLTGTDLAVVNPKTGSGMSFLLTVVSHGPDGKGAYNYHGQRVSPCTGTARDVENCDGDAVFLNKGYVSHVQGSMFYDDAYLITDIVRDTDKWQFTSGAKSMRNKQPAGGMVGIGTATPMAPLEVAGNIRVEEYRADQFCDPTGANCFPAKIIGGNTATGGGLECGGGTMNGIRNAAAGCNQKVVMSAISAGTCPAGQYIYGFDAGGNVRCATPP